ncbi:hypothetical protein OH492_09130 [Vibrio chagasii]|nr:hypothetical protein [Vibrio chagasii]
MIDDVSLSKNIGSDASATRYGRGSSLRPTNNTSFITSIPSTLVTTAIAISNPHNVNGISYNILVKVRNRDRQRKESESVPILFDLD